MCEFVEEGLDERVSLTERSRQAFILPYCSTTCLFSQLCGKVSSDIAYPYPP